MSRKPDNIDSVLVAYQASNVSSLVLQEIEKQTYYSRRIVGSGDETFMSILSNQIWC